MSQLSIYLLGPPQIEYEDQQIKVDTRKAIALLTYIAVTQKSHRRDSLVTLLWPEYNQSRGRTNLRRTLYALRKSLHGGWLEVDREEIGLNPAAKVWLDVDEFHQYLTQCRSHAHPVTQSCPKCIPPLTAAIELYRGDFLSGFSLKDSLNFDEWQTTQTEDLRREFATGLERLVECHCLQRDFESAIQFAKRWMALDPLNENAHCQLMQLYNWSGQRSSVIHQYETCRKILQDEIGISPQPSTTALYDAIIKGKGPKPPSSLDQVHLPSKQRPFLEPASTSLASDDQATEAASTPKSIFVAREPELEKLNHYLDSALVGQGQPVFVIGDAGKGKTTLIQEFARRAQDRIPNLLFSSGNCNAHTGFGDPYLPFREILSLLTSDVDALWAAGTISQKHTRRLWDAFPIVIEALLGLGSDLIETVVPGVPLARRAAAYTTGGMSDQITWLAQLNKVVAFKVETPHDPHLQQTALFDQYTRVMRAVANDRPLLLAIDNLQWADTGSISLLFHLSRRLMGRPILILGAYRPEEVALGRVGERHPLEAVIHELQRIYGDITLDLTRAEKLHFVEAYLDSEPNHLSTKFRATLYRKTNGHPLFTVELLRGMQERGDLVQDDEGFWVEGDTLNWEILPTRIEAVIAERVNRLGTRSQEALRAASVEGEVFSAEVLARVLSIDEREMIDCLSDQLERKHRLVRAQEIQRLGARRLSRYRFQHILFQNYLYQSLDPVERAYLHEAVGTILEERYQGETQEIAPSLARHFQEAGIPEKAIEYLFQAGENAKRRSAHEAAITHFTKGLALLEKIPNAPKRDQKELEYCLALGVPLVLTKGHSTPEVEEIYCRASDLCQQIGEQSQHFHALLGLRRFYLHRGSLEKALEMGEQLIDLAHQMQDALYISRAYMMHLETLYRLGDFNHIHEYYRQGMLHYKDNQHTSHIFLYGNDTGIGCRIFEVLALWHLGYPEQALRGAKEMLAITRELSHPFTLVFGLYFAAKLYQLCRDVQSVDACVNELLQIAQERGFSMYVAWGTFLQGWVLTETGEVDEGIQQMQQGLNVWQNMGAKLLLPNFMVNLAEAYQKIGHIEAGLKTLEEALAIMRETGELTFEAELHRIKGELLAMNEKGNVEAEACYLKALQIAQRQGAKAWELRAAISLCGLHEQGANRDRALDILKTVYNDYHEGFSTPDLIATERLLTQ
jgi:predicted ATPase/DNA-binding SARP family transcriptional activator/predicted negative regulator of RcsB-dependent stress response